MTDTAQVALDFARKCLDWEKASCDGNVVSRNALAAADHFTANSFESAWPYISQFLGTRYWIQTNRDRMTNARWRVLTGVQDVARRGCSRETVEVIDDDQTRAIMAACVLAADELKLGSV